LQPVKDHATAFRPVVLTLEGGESMQLLIIVEDLAAVVEDRWHLK